MTDSFGLKIGVEGEKEFKNSLAKINQSFRVIGSEMKLVTSLKYNSLNVIANSIVVSALNKKKRTLKAVLSLGIMSLGTVPTTQRL